MFPPNTDTLIAPIDGAFIRDEGVTGSLLDSAHHCVTSGKTLDLTQFLRIKMGTVHHLLEGLL
jgi:hypothetical protein